MTDLLVLFAFAFIGVIAGLLAGLLGMSGGMITVPCLLFLFGLLHIPQSSIMHLAIGTSLASMLFNSLSATWAHNQKKGVLWNIVKDMAPTCIIGSILGAFIAHLLNGKLLEGIFGFFAIIFGFYYLLPTPFLSRKDKEAFSPDKRFFVWSGIVVGGLSNLLGIGGGVITASLLLFLHAEEKKAIGTAAAVGFLITLLGTIAYLFLGLQSPAQDVPYTLGYLYLPAFCIISITTFFAAPFGAKLTHILSPFILRKIFALVLMAVGVVMCFSLFS